MSAPPASSTGASPTTNHVPQPPSPPPPPYTIFDRRQIALVVTIASVAATFSGFASNIYFPALPLVASDLGVSIDLVNLSITTYLIFQALAPSLWGPVSDAKGRRVAYCATFAVFMGACIGLALTPNYAALIVLRCLQSTGSASTIAIGSGVIGDITTRETRGGYMGIFQAGLLAPVAVGPIIGGALSDAFGWRSVFWFLVVYGGVFLAVLVFFLPETLRAIVGDGSRTPSQLLARYPLVWFQRTTKRQRQLDPPDAPLPPKKRIDVLGPFRILFSKQAVVLIMFVAVYYAVWQMSMTAMSTLFNTDYGLSETEVGLTFLANGVGSIVGTLLTGKVLNYDYRKVKESYDQSLQQRRDAAAQQLSGQNGEGNQENDSGKMDGENNGDKEKEDEEYHRNFPLIKARLRLVPIFSLLQSAATAVFGWTIQERVHISVPIIMTFLTGWAAISIQSVVMTYLVDVFPDRSAAASASLNLARCLFAAGGTSFIMPLIHAIGVGRAFTICALAQVVMLLVGGFHLWCLRKPDIGGK